MSQRVVARGGNDGNVWNDGIFDGVKKVCVGRDCHGVSYVKFKYVKDDTVESHEHGVINQTPKEFAINYPNEYITSVEGTYDAPCCIPYITSLVFKTSNGRTSPSFGNERFVLSNNGQKLVGFHGRYGDAIDALGAHFLSESSLLPKKLEAKGGPGGNTWDDGAYNNIRKVYVGRDKGCVTRVMFDYVKDINDEPQSRAYGVLKEELEEFLLDPNEYIISVEGTYGRVKRFECIVITSLAFTTSKGRTSSTFGATKFVLEDNGRNLVGFHGRSDHDSLIALGAYFALP